MEGLASESKDLAAGRQYPCDCWSPPGGVSLQNMNLAASGLEGLFLQCAISSSEYLTSSCSRASE